MADITKCKGVEGVTKCDSCYRQTAKANEHYQSYFTSAPIQNPHGKNPICTWYWADDSWQDPQRDKAIAQNGNVGYSDSDVIS